MPKTIIEKSCTTCKRTYPISNFYRASRKKDGLTSQCKSCVKQYNKKHNKNFSKTEKFKYSCRKYKIKKKYGLTLEQYDEIKRRQGGLCAICKKAAHRLVVDHCHKTGRIRGLLCAGCNTALGKLGDDIESLQRVLQYLGG